MSKAGEKFAFFRENDDKTWCCVIVESVGDGAGEVKDAAIRATHDEARAWAETIIGPLNPTPVYEAPRP